MSGKLELRYPCPVCLGATLQKATLEGPEHLVVDHCPRCGGVWFEQGEVQRMRSFSPEQLLEQVAAVENVPAMQCHSCSTLFDRTLDTCPGCGWRKQLDCPSCNTPLETATYAGITLDACRRCKGVWFDRHELAEIWQLEFEAAVQRSDRMRDDPADVVLGALAYDPFLTIYAAHTAGHVLAAGAQAAPAVIEAAGHAASSVFEAIVEIISSLFD